MTQEILYNYCPMLLENNLTMSVTYTKDSRPFFFTHIQKEKISLETAINKSKTFVKWKKRYEITNTVHNYWTVIRT